MNYWLVLSHLACFVAGAVMWHWIAKREGEKLTGDDSHHTPHLPPYLSRNTALILTAAVFLLSIGVQQLFYQDAKDKIDNRQDEHQRCISQWGVDVINALAVRSDATSDLEEKRKARDEAVDGIIAVVTEAQAHPNRDTESEFAAALAAWVVARDAYTAAQSDTTDAREENPFPELEC